MGSTRLPNQLTQTQRRRLGKLLVESRKEAGLSQEAVGKAVGVPASTIQRYETGFVKLPDPYKLLKIAEAVGIEVEELYAAAGLTPASGLPSFGTYLRTRYDQLPEKALKEVEAHFDALREQYDKEDR